MDPKKSRAPVTGTPNLVKLPHLGALDPRVRSSLLKALAQAGEAVFLPKSLRAAA